MVGSAAIQAGAMTTVAKYQKQTAVMEALTQAKAITRQAELEFEATRLKTQATVTGLTTTEKAGLAAFALWLLLK
jgi:hypothetical protein